MESGYLELVSAIKTLNQQTLKKWDQTALCEIVTQNNDGTYNIRMLSDEGENGSIIPNVRNGSKYSFKEGDQGVLFKYKNQITMSFLVFKIGGSVNPCGSSTTPIWIDSNGTPQECSGVEVTSHKVTEISSASTDLQYPSAKCVYNIVGNIESLLAAI